MAPGCGDLHGPARGRLPQNVRQIPHRAGCSVLPRARFRQHPTAQPIDHPAQVAGDQDSDRSVDGSGCLGSFGLIADGHHDRGKALHRCGQHQCEYPLHRTDLPVQSQLPH